jgi:hypothetical protein
MTEIIDFKTKRPLPFDLIVRVLQSMPPATRIEVIAASCDGADWSDIFELAAYSFSETLWKQYGRPVADDAIRQTLHRIIEGVLRAGLEQ